MNNQTMGEIDGRIDYKTVGQADHPITSDEREYSIQVAHNLATRNGIDLETMIKDQYASEREEATK